MTIHQLQLEAFGGSPGVRDHNLFESAQRPLNLHFYEDVEDHILLAATYAEAITRNHPFFDGNKRTAFHTCVTFLRLNGLQCMADEAHAAAAMLRLTEGSLTREEFAGWLRSTTIRHP